ncbi:hypothetical protein JG688_00000890, partial [Phytophthora aleatoria]
MDDAPPPKKKKKQRSYTIREKRDAVRRMPEVGVEEWPKTDKLLRFTSHATSKTMKGKGRKETFPDVSAIVTYMKESAVTRCIMEYMLELEPAWVTNDMADKRSGLLALQLMRERLANRHDFTSQKPQTAKKSREDLEQTRAEFALDFWRTYAEYEPSEIVNVDETAINFDMPPRVFGPGRGRRDAARLRNTSKHAGRMSAGLTIRAD